MDKQIDDFKFAGKTISQVNYVLNTGNRISELKTKLIEETNYLLEIKQSKLIREACKGLPNIKFPNYYTNLSSEIFFCCVSSATSSVISVAIPFLKLLIPFATSPIKLEIFPLPNNRTTKTTTIATCQKLIPINIL